MDAIDAIKAAAKATGTPTTHIGPLMGKGPAYLANTANRGSSPQANTLAAMAATMGYALALVPADSLPPDALPIDPPTTAR